MLSATFGTTTLPSPDATLSSQGALLALIVRNQCAERAAATVEIEVSYEHMQALRAEIAQALAEARQAEEDAGFWGDIADVSAKIDILFWARGRYPDNTLDGAIAAVRPGAVRTDGAILDIGTISSTPAQDRIGCAVQKSGRTTGLTKGTMRLIDEREADELYAAMPPGVESSGGSAANTMAGLASPLLAASGGAR